MLAKLERREHPVTEVGRTPRWAARWAGKRPGAGAPPYFSRAWLALLQQPPSWGSSDGVTPGQPRSSGLHTSPMLPALLAALPSHTALKLSERGLRRVSCLSRTLAKCTAKGGLNQVQQFLDKSSQAVREAQEALHSAPNSSVQAVAPGSSCPELCP